MMSNTLKLYLLSVLGLCPPTFAADEQFYMFGKLNYAEKKLIISTVDGILEQVAFSSGQTVPQQSVIARIQPFDPNLKEQVMKTGDRAYIVAEIISRKGSKVDKYQPIVALTEPQNLHIRALSFFPASNHLYLGKTVEVIFDPDGEQLNVPGTVSAIYDRQSDEGISSRREVEIKVDYARCTAQSICLKNFKFGNVVKVQFKK